MKFIATTAFVVTTLLLSVSSVDAGVRKREGDSKNKRPDRGGSTVASHHAARAEKITAHEKTMTANYNPSIVGGRTNATSGQFPYYVYLGDCGGALIARNVVLTSAFCKGTRADNNTVVIGTLENVERVLKVDKEVVHPKYDLSTSENNLSLLLLNETYCLPDENKLVLNFNNTIPAYGDALTVLGTGSTSRDGGAASNVLEHSKLDVVNCSDSVAAYETFGYNFKSSFCARREGKDSCQADNGSPVVKESANSSHLLVGVVSWRKGCDNTGVNTRVSSHTQWIKETVCDTWRVEAPFCGNGYSKACSSSSSSCEDASGWYDSTGTDFNCAFYEKTLSNCHQFGGEYSNFGKTANEACCECKRQKEINYCDPAWKDAYEDGCAWYRNGTNLDVYGWDYPNAAGVTAKMACC